MALDVAIPHFICVEAPNLVKLVVKTPNWLGNNPNTGRSILLLSFFIALMPYLTTQVYYVSMYIVRKESVILC